MKRLAWMLLLVLTPALVGQEPGDSGTGPPPNSPEAAQIRKQIIERWHKHVTETLGLTDDQATKLQATEEHFDSQRQPIRARQRAINQQLNGELASGTPNQDRVKQLINERQDNQLRLQQLNRDEGREMQGYLTPVQHARYQEERRRFQERVAQVIRQRREERREMQRPRAGPRKRPRP